MPSPRGSTCRDYFRVYPKSVLLRFIAVTSFPPHNRRRDLFITLLSVDPPASEEQYHESAPSRADTGTEASLPQLCSSLLLISKSSPWSLPYLS